MSSAGTQHGVDNAYVNQINESGTRSRNQHLDERRSPVRHGNLSSESSTDNVNPDSNGSGSVNSDGNPNDSETPGSVRGPGQPIPRISLRANVLSARAQLFDAFFRRVAVGYAHVFPLTARRVIEFGFLLQAFFLLAVFIHLHFMFVRSPITCLDKLRSRWPTEAESQSTFSSLPLSESAQSLEEDEEPVKRNHYAPGDPRTPREPWPQYGVLRVEVIRNPNPKYSLADSYAKQFYGSNLDYTEELDDSLTELYSEVADDGHSMLLKPTASTGAGGNRAAETTSTGAQLSVPSRHKALLHESDQLLHSLRSMPRHVYAYLRDTVDLIVRTFSFASAKSAAVSSPVQPAEIPGGMPLPTVWSLNYIKHNILCAALTHVASLVNSVSTSAVQFCREVPLWLQNLYGPAHMEENYIIEYALEYGFLRLSPAMRKRLNITVKLVVLDPEKDTCFGGFLSRFLMEEFLGYEDLLLGSIKHLAVSESVKGHMANVVTGQHYRLVSSQMSRSSYLVAILVMLLFTFCVSVSLRYSSHQLLVVVADILQVFETNVAVGIPATPFMTVILALVAIETIMSEFFGDSFTAFYVIFIVSICDHYEAVFCRTAISRRYWPRFFYLYHFAFYAYHYRFSGQFSGLALWVSWLFILHSMIYFFHHYELPHFLSDWQLTEMLARMAPPPQMFESFQIEVVPNRSPPSLQSGDSSFRSNSLNSRRPETNNPQSNEDIDVLGADLHLSGILNHRPDSSSLTDHSVRPSAFNLGDNEEESHQSLTVDPQSDCMPLHVPNEGDCCEPVGSG